ncbi:MAG TPA: hypothetical protein VGA09_07625, partial [Candidatus Binatia bacterium]
MVKGDANVIGNATKSSVIQRWGVRRGGRPYARSSKALVLAVLMALTACSKPPASKAPESAAAVNAGGVDLAGMDHAVKPGDDFFAFANGTWVKSTEIPADRSSYGPDAMLEEEATLRTRKLLEDAAKSA